METPSLPAILRPARRQVNAERRDGKFGRRRREWKRESEDGKFGIPSSNRWLIPRAGCYLLEKLFHEIYKLRQFGSPPLSFGQVYGVPLVAVVDSILSSVSLVGNNQETWLFAQRLRCGI